jgi:predicted phosphodiesterase
MKLRFVVISDTHGMHKALSVPDGDVLIHAGDFCAHGHFLDTTRFLSWFNSHPHKHKIFIAGNHDVFMERGNYSEISLLLKGYPELVYLNDSHHMITAEDNSDCVTFWGSPVQPEFFNWAFNRARGPAIKKHWDLIPHKTDILITHGPSYGILDECPAMDDFSRLVHVGCKDLDNALNDVRPKVHCFGHIHMAYGTAWDGRGCLKLNASICNEDDKPVNKPLVFDWDNGKITPVRVL